MGSISITLASPSLRGRFCNSPNSPLSGRCQPQKQLLAVGAQARAELA